jgi:hypothetical protein
MRTRPLALLAAAALYLGGGTQAARCGEHVARPLIPPVGATTPAIRQETLWIFDADFDDLAGDNAGWTVYDRSGTVFQANHWHHDTIRINGFEHLGDSTWWCGMYSDCWYQPRGYGNEWLQTLERHFTEAADSTGTMTLEYDQRYAIDHNYDYGYVDIRSPAHPDSWQTVVAVTNPGFAGTPGSSQDWDSTSPLGPGHMVVDISEYVGDTFDLRFRFESDDHYSSDDTPDEPPGSPYLDGAWQLDNITLEVNGHVVYYDDAESAGDNGWIHDDIQPAGQTGVTFWRGRYGIDFVTGREFSCSEPPVGSWMYAAVDPFTSNMVDGENAWLMSPPIDISGASRLVAHWEGWTDLEGPTNDVFDVQHATSDLRHCVQDLTQFVDEEPGCWYHTPQWWDFAVNWDPYCGSDWLGVLWMVWNEGPPEEPHRGGLFLDRLRLGIPPGDPSTSWVRDGLRRFHDWFADDLVAALAYEAWVVVRDNDGISSARLVASNDLETWDSYEMTRESGGGNWWIAPAPAGQMTPGSEIHYYYEATDGEGNTSTFPPNAPDRTLEFSILPIHGSTEDPCVLLVDKSGGGTPGAMRTGPPYIVGSELGMADPRISVELYYGEMLDALGYEYDVYNVLVGGAGGEEAEASDGPDTLGMKYYDTQVWCTGDVQMMSVSGQDQLNLTVWLNQASAGKERNLLLTGNSIGWELVEEGADTMGFYSTWLKSYYLDNSVGVVTVDSVPGLEDHAGGWGFMTSDDSECILSGGCPVLHNFDVLEPAAGSVGTETVADYVKLNGERRPAGVAYTHPTMNYQTVNLGFGMECMIDGVVGVGAANYTPEGYYLNGIEDRVDLMRNIMEYFGKEPGGQATGVSTGAGWNQLSNAAPNPVRQSTTIAYAVREAGRTTIRVYNVAGKGVRTLLDHELAAGTSGRVTWDGTDDAGERCAAGVYFYRISAPGFISSEKMVLLR